MSLIKVTLFINTGDHWRVHLNEWVRSTEFSEAWFWSYSSWRTLVYIHMCIIIMNWVTYLKHYSNAFGWWLDKTVQYLILGHIFIRVLRQCFCIKHTCTLQDCGHIDLSQRSTFRWQVCEAWVQNQVVCVQTIYVKMEYFDNEKVEVYLDFKAKQLLLTSPGFNL